MYYFDIHIHTSRYSPCSHLEPAAMVEKAKKLGLHGIAITEHDTIWEAAEVKELKRKSKAKDLVILRGQEIRGYNEDGTFQSDFLIFGSDQIFPPELSSLEVIQYARQQPNSIIIAAHPYRMGFGCGDDVYNFDIDGLETLHPSYLSLDIKKAEAASRKMGVASLGSSDSHRADTIGCIVTVFENQIYTEEDLIKEIKAKRCWPLKNR